MLRTGSISGVFLFVNHLARPKTSIIRADAFVAVYERIPSTYIGLFLIPYFHTLVVNNTLKNQMPTTNKMPISTNPAINKPLIPAFWALRAPTNPRMAHGIGAKKKSHKGSKEKKAWSDPTAFVGSCRIGM